MGRNVPKDAQGRGILKTKVSHDSDQNLGQDAPGSTTVPSPRHYPLLRALEGFHNRQQCAHKFPLRRHDLLTSSDVLLLVRRGLERVLNEVSQSIMDVVHDELAYLREDLRRAEA